MTRRAGVESHDARFGTADDDARLARFGPVLDGDELVGKVDATADRQGGVLIVDALHEDGDWSAARRSRVDAELGALGEWLGLEVVRS